MNPRSVHILLDFRVLRVIVAILLLLAATLKMLQLANDTVSGRNFWSTRAFLSTLVLVELAFGLWLAIGVYPIWSRRSTVALFGAFTLFSLFLGARGEHTCPCLGKFEISPWVMAVFDYLIVLALAMSSVPHTERHSRAPTLRLYALAGSYVLIAVPTLITLVHYSPRGLTVPLRTDARLSERVAFDLKNPTTEEILHPIRNETGISLTVDERLNAHPPVYGRLGPTKLKIWSAMELVAQKQPIAARWDRTENGYHLSSAAPFGSRLAPWLASAGLAFLLLCAIGLRWLRSSPSTRAVSIP